MTDRTEPTRRDFLRAAAAAGGGLAIGFLLPGCRGPGAVTADWADQTGELVPNAWLKILPDDRIVFILDRVEMGQGTMTSQATIMAEELEVDPAKIHVEHAPADRRYANPDPDLGFQITGASSSTKSSWEPLRRAGATAREMLRQAAAAAWGVPLAQCVAEDGAIVHPPTGKRATYGSLARAAAHQPMPEPKLKDPGVFKYIGKSRTRLDARMKVDGSGVFGIDVKVPEMLAAYILRPPTLRGAVKRYDAAEAKRQPGVVDVFAIPTGIAVVASSYWRAKAAAQRVRAEWEGGPLAGVSTPALREQYRKEAQSKGKVVRDDGDVERAFGSGAKLIEAVYEVPYLAHAPMEPMNATAHVQGDRCTVWAPTQAAGVAVSELRKTFGFAEANITIHTTLIGGGFGRRLHQDYIVEAVHIARRVGKPVKVVWSREDDTRHGVYRPMAHHVLKGAVDARGQIVGWSHRIVSQSIVGQVGKLFVGALAPSAMPQSLNLLLGRSAATMYGSGLLGDTTMSEGAGDFLYAVPNLRVEDTPIDSGVPIGFWRSVGHSGNAFVVESFLDEVAHAAGKDPYQMRRALLAGSPRLLAVLDLAARKAGWGTAPPAGVFRGIAVSKSFGSYCAQVAEVSVEGVGGAEGKAVRVRRVVGAIDCGMIVNPDLVRAQVESAVVFGLSAALKQAITLKDGRVEQGNFHQLKVLRMHETPVTEVHIVPSGEPPSGVGEPGLPPVAPAVANAIFAATGKRIRALPIEQALGKGA